MPYPLRYNNSSGSGTAPRLRLKAVTFGRSPNEVKHVDEALEVLEILAEKVTEDKVSKSGIDSRNTGTQSDQLSYRDHVVNKEVLVESVKNDEAASWQKALSQLRREHAARRYEATLRQKLTSGRPAGRFLDSDGDLEMLAEHKEGEGRKNAEESSRKFQGDIVLYGDQANAVVESAIESVIANSSDPGSNANANNDTNFGSEHKRVKRKFIGPLARRWPVGEPIQYAFDGSHTTNERRVIELALAHWSNITCLDFKQVPDYARLQSGNRIVFTDVDGCASNVGRHPLGEQQFVSLAPECMRLGVIAHEVAHALGFWHEQSRADRDKFVDVQWHNIDRFSKGQFLKEQSADVDTAGVPYDYGSIMHYRSKAFARTEDLFTIETNVNDYQKTIGQRDQLSFNDIRLMNKIYCTNVCRRDLPCLRGGYTDPRDCSKCRCPDGFTGALCDRVMPGYGAVCGGVTPLGASWTSIHSPNYPNFFKEGEECSWLLVAPEGFKVEFEFIGHFDLYCKARHSLCMDYVEIRNTTDFANTGMRYCCYTPPPGVVHSSTHELLVLFRSFYQRGRGFEARARAVRQRPGAWLEWSPWGQCSHSCGGCGGRQRSRRCTSAGSCV